MLRTRLRWLPVLLLACPATGVAFAQEASSDDHPSVAAERRFEARSWAPTPSPTLPPIVTSIADDPLDDLESIDARARQAERLLKRSLRNSLGDRLEEAARSLPFFEKVLTRGGASAAQPRPIGETSLRSAAASVEGNAQAFAPAAPWPRTQGPVSASVGFRLDSHPRVQIRTRVLSLTSLVEIPVLEREIRLSLDQPLGRHGRASLRGGASAEGKDWATLSFSLQF